MCLCVCGCVIVNGNPSTPVWPKNGARRLEKFERGKSEVEKNGKMREAERAIVAVKCLMAV